MDDIPEAFRETPVHKPVKRSRPKRRLFALAISGVVVLGLGFWMVGQSRGGSSTAPGNTPVKAGQPANPTASASPDNLFGHLPYQEAPASELTSITADGSMKLRKAAAIKYEEMVAAAAADGITLVPISAFRSIADQQAVFFDVKAERNQDANQRAAVSAPPGYSEHHTGYAIDVGDGSAPDTNLSPDFDQTAAYRWLEANAARFNFELSFPKNNPQRISYEPWHWRFAGDRDSLETFYRAHNLKK